MAAVAQVSVNVGNLVASSASSSLQCAFHNA